MAYQAGTPTVRENTNVKGADRGWAHGHWIKAAEAAHRLMSGTRPFHHPSRPGRPPRHMGPAWTAKGPSAVKTGAREDSEIDQPLDLGTASFVSPITQRNGIIDALLSAGSLRDTLRLVNGDRAARGSPFAFRRRTATMDAQARDGDRSRATNLAHNVEGSKNPPLSKDRYPCSPLNADNVVEECGDIWQNG